MINISTYFKLKNDQFVLCEDFVLQTDNKGFFSNVNWVEGAVVIKNDAKIFMGLECWDCVIPLWGYICHGIRSVKNNQPYATHFPDQPLKLEFRLYKSGMVAVILEEDEGRKLVLEQQAFVEIFSGAAKHFFEHMMRFDPKNVELYQAQLVDL